MTPLPGPGDRFAEEGAAVVTGKTEIRPRAAVILGSGLDPAVAGMTTDVELAYADLPGYPPPAVPGHAGRLALGTLAGVPIAAFLGRVHFYEGHPMSVVTLPVRLAAEIGARTVISTAAVGGLDPALDPGTLVVGSDHINFLGVDPLRGWRDAEGRPAFVDLSGAYDAPLSKAAVDAAREAGVPVTRGVYASMPGPTFETPAEEKFLRNSGATVVGMSVVPEACAAAALGLAYIGLFCVTNRVGGGVSHEEVVRVADAFAPRLGHVLERVLSAA